MPSTPHKLVAVISLAAVVLAKPASAQDEDTPDTPETEGAAAAGDTPGAEPAKAEPAAAEKPDPHKTFGHAGQPGLRVGLSGGYRMVFRYDESPLCADYKPEEEKPPFSGTVKEQQKFCGHAAPFALDLGLSYAPTDSVEPFLWARIGLQGEEETATDPVLILGAGVRLYTMSDSAFKIFVEPGFGVELEEGGNALSRQNRLEYKTDVLFHLAAGAHVDVSKNVGLYFDAGLTTGVLRAIHSTLELTAGVQGRAF